MLVWISRAVVVLLLITPALYAETRCTLNGIQTPCTVLPIDEQGVQRVEIGQIDPKDWKFDEKDLPVDATALHVELLNDTTYEKALRYATADFYRMYRMQQARKLVDHIKMRMISYVRAKYGSQMTPEETIEAIVLETGLPIIPVPAAVENHSGPRLDELLSGK
jgi:hypothetical protein